MSEPTVQGELRDTPDSWEVRGERTSFEGKVWDVVSDDVVMPDGRAATRDYVKHTGAVGVLALDEQGRVLLVRQYRHPVRHRLWELPAGLLDIPGENPLRAAQRELWEEAHHKAGDWRVLIDVYPTSGGSDESIRVFLARDLSEAEGEKFAADGEELDMQVRWFPLDEVVSQALAGELHNGALVAAAMALKAAQAAGALDTLRPADAPWPARPF
ncbi:NUDIX domain-containing protein [Streptacidiphilus jiangxiensis]|uniref:ADP-ribose pyrophosphatase n=1 Tax=Streptacidiphilus jiangxiensis TaxID=235985 RepID=A0A1H8AM24_STRJI|nr:NUDIX hydrolase [Streptacidiphilus jiangxiensis]SEM70799.1 ADP-ribose pyrophosphatase [Streptacidiphilus jiangxiensis]